MLKLDQYLEKMFHVALNISNIYCDTKNFLTEKQQAYLSTAIEYENELFEHIDRIRQCSNTKQDDLELKYLLVLSRKNLDDETYYTLSTRFKSYFNYQLYHFSLIEKKKMKSL